MSDCIEYERYNRESKRPDSFREQDEGCIHCGMGGGWYRNDCTAYTRVIESMGGCRLTTWRKFRGLCIDCWDENQHLFAQGFQLNSI